MDRRGSTVPAHEDELTGLGNRLAFLAVGQTPSDTWRSLAVIDADHFRSTNHEHGIAAGDEALRELAARLSSGLPVGSHLFRLAGDEFVVLCPTSMDRLATALELVAASRPSSRLRFSAGVVPIDPGETAERRLPAADASMYLAKHLGRARIVRYGPEVQAFIEDRRNLYTQVTRLREENRFLRGALDIDPLTGAGSRRAFDQRIDQVDARRDGATWAVVFLDIDEFHEFNHLHGDLRGDQALRDVARALLESTRDGQVFRKGGEEFVVLTSVLGREDAVRLAERLRAAVADLRIPHGAAGRPFVTVSIGVALTDDATNLTTACDLAARRAYWLKVNDRRGEIRADDGDLAPRDPS